MNTAALITDIKSGIHFNQLVLIGVDGRSGAGKSTLAGELAAQLPNATLVHLDDYNLYAGEESIKKVVNEVILPLKKLKPKKVVILEGIFALNKTLINFYDYKIWIDILPEIGFQRGLARDMSMNGINNADKWLNYWLPKEDEYISVEQPQHLADFTINATMPL